MLTRLYLIGGAMAAVTIIAGLAYWHGYSTGRNAVLNRLKDDRITILKDGVSIDNNVIGADDNALCDLLGGCS